MHLTFSHNFKFRPNIKTNQNGGNEIKTKQNKTNKIKSNQNNIKQINLIK
jgi:hypothetical protein